MLIWVGNSRGNTKIRVTIKSASRKHYFNSFMLGSERSLPSFCHNRHVYKGAKDGAVVKTWHEMRLALNMLRKQGPDL